MAEAVIVPGPCQIKLNTGTAGALESLGWTINQVDIEEQVKFEEVFGDQNGGEQGNPIEFQHLGLMDVISMELSKFDWAVAQKVAQRINGTTSSYSGTKAAGTSPTPGTLLFSTTSYYRLLLVPTDATYIRNYPIAVCLDPINSNLSAKYQRRMLRWMCFPPVAGGAIWNTTAV